MSWIAADTILIILSFSTKSYVYSCFLFYFFMSVLILSSSCFDAINVCRYIYILENLNLPFLAHPNHNLQLQLMSIHPKHLPLENLSCRFQTNTSYSVLTGRLLDLHSLASIWIKNESEFHLKFRLDISQRKSVSSRYSPSGKPWGLKTWNLKISTKSQTLRCN